MKLRLVDASGPFFRHCQARVINWSKIPFEEIETGEALDQQKTDIIKADFSALARRCAETGFNAVTLDDLAHLWVSSTYPPGLQSLLRKYRAFFSDLFTIAQAHGLSVYLTTDVMFYAAQAPALPKQKTCEALMDAATDMFTSFPQVRGIILRLGECDGTDVQGRFKSRLTIRTPRQARALIRSLLPIFEKHGRQLIVRTWTVGAYRIGDLIWNRNTFDRVFSGIDSPALIISMKHGESDFFRYLPVNKLFFRSKHQKIVELQARREYEGAGQYPSFVGWYYEHILRELSDAENLIGAWIWIQTGGWTNFRRLTFLDKDAVWNDINAYVCARLISEDTSTEQAVEDYSRQFLPTHRPQKLLLFLRLSDEVVSDLLYIDQLARLKLFFRRVRVPPLLSVFWDQIIINHSMRKLLRCFVTDPDSAVLQGHAALQKLKSMQLLASELSLPVEDIKFQYDTFRILELARHYYFAPFREETAALLLETTAAYKSAYSRRYSVRLDFSPFPLAGRKIRLLLAVWMRKQRGYRVLDRILMIGVLSWLSPVFLISRHRSNADLLDNRAMGIKTVLK